MEYKALTLEVDDLSHDKGTAVIRHAVYDNIDLVNDVARKGMFTKTWGEKKSADGQSVDISFYVNHDDTQAPGRVIDVFDKEGKAFTKVKMGTHTLGSDTLKMLDEGTIRKASFGFHTIKAQPLPSKKSVRQLLEVDHLETSVLTRLSANPKAGIESVKKHFTAALIELKELQPDEQKFLQDVLGQHTDQLTKLVAFAGKLPVSSDLYTTANYWAGRINDLIGDIKCQIRWNGVRGEDGKVMQVKSVEEITEVKDHLDALRKFVRNTTASDGCIIDAMGEIKSLEQILALDTADTQGDATEPAVSADEAKALSDEINLLLFKHFD
jgi:HK97 family phage prohead protease